MKQYFKNGYQEFVGAWSEKDKKAIAPLIEKGLLRYNEWKIPDEEFIVNVVSYFKLNYSKSVAIIERHDDGYIHTLIIINDNNTFYMKQDFDPIGIPMEENEEPFEDVLKAVNGEYDGYEKVDRNNIFKNFDSNSEFCCLVDILFLRYFKNKKGF